MRTNLFILGACGTFMAGLAQLAQALANEQAIKIFAFDQHVYPPMSTVLADQGIELIAGYDQFASCYQAQASKATNNLVLVGNAMSRGNPAIEYMLTHHIPYTSGPQWLYEQVLANQTVLAVAGTHGKTTTSSMLAWILDFAGYQPGFLIGGLAQNFSSSACLGAGKYFVLEADEYDTAFFDKRPKFMHYRPDVLLINNIEFDHADIFRDLAAIQQQFQYLLRTVPSNGTVIYPANDMIVDETLQNQLWSQSVTHTIINNDKDDDNDQDQTKNPAAASTQANACQAKLKQADGSSFTLYWQQQAVGEVHWQLNGRHNVQNALAAASAAITVGVTPKQVVAALNQFSGVRRRQEKIAQVGSIAIYEDFAHHPTAIKTTLNGFKQKLANQQGRLIVLLELASNTMRSGLHDQAILDELAQLDQAYIYTNGASKKTYKGQLDALIAKHNIKHCAFYTELSKLLADLTHQLQPEDTVLIMSNGAFDGIYHKLPTLLA